MMKSRFAPVSLYLWITLFFFGTAFPQTDPGVRSSTGINAGQALASVAANSPAGSLEFFQNGLGRFQDSEAVRGGANNGLGPRFNFNQCSGCHSQPAVGGSSPNAGVYPYVGPNPESTVISAGIVNGNFNAIPSFISSGGPTVEARFPFFFNSDGTVNTNAPNGGVEDLYTISGRSDAGNCSLQQPSFSLAQQTGNIIFRIPTPTFGTGLIENIDDSTLLANQAAQAGNGIGVSGTFNHNGNDGTISRFGWKAQNKSLETFAGEAYNVEMGITNELFTQERPLPGEDQFGSGLPHSSGNNCLMNPTPEDTTNFSPTVSSSDQYAVNASIPSDTAAFAMFMRFLAPPTPSSSVPGGSTSISNGLADFKAIGCAVCHTQSLTTSASSFTSSLSNVTANLFSDLEIHHMGSGLADNVAQGGAGGDQFRTAPLWGVGQRIFFLHDGRCSNLLCAIEAHAGNGSEATTAEENFDSLTSWQKQDVLNFLRSR
jgi:CxxC motif-containing protein (DUF1111 family)